MQPMKTKTPAKPIAIFKPGTFTAMSGDTLSFTDSDVADMAANYNPALLNAPLVLGHPKDNHPAYGWVNALHFTDGLLYAVPDMVTPEFADWVNQKFYNAVSASIYPKEHPNNPTPGQYYLRHVGFLGGNPPAVKGLPPPEFGDSATLITIDFTETTGATMAATTESVKDEPALSAEKAALAAEKDKLAKREAEFTEKEAALNASIVALAKERDTANRAELLDFTEQLVKEGRLLPKDKPGLLEFMSQIKPTSSLEFGEGDSKTVMPKLAWLKSFLQALPKAIEFGEVSGAAASSGETLTDTQIAQRARAYHQQQTKIGNPLSFADAVDAVNAGLDRTGG